MTATAAATAPEQADRGPVVFAVLAAWLSSHSITLRASEPQSRRSISPWRGRHELTAPQR